VTSASRWLVVALVAAAAAVAHAESADDYFKHGRELLKAGKFREACEQFEKSQALDPALGTLYNIAQCDAEIGKLATALAAYKDVVARDTNPTRKQASTEAIARLEQRVPHLVVHADSGTAVQLAGKPLALDTPIPIDFGNHTVHAVPKAGSPIDRSITIDQEGQTIEVSLKTTAVPSAHTVEPRHPTPPPSPAVAPSHRKTYAVATIAVGGAGLATGLVFGVLARSRWSDAKAICDGGTTCASQADADAAAKLGSQARSRATLSTIFTIAGGAVAATGIVLYVTAPKSHEVAIAAVPATDGGTFVVAGRF
jgi:tetratricopeptide (TPR) repeat protein